MYANQTHFIVATKDGETKVYAEMNHSMMLIKNVNKAAYVSPAQARTIIDFHLKPKNPGWSFEIKPNSERSNYYKI